MARTFPASQTSDSSWHSSAYYGRTIYINGDLNVASSGQLES